MRKKDLWPILILLTIGSIVSSFDAKAAAMTQLTFSSINNYSPKISADGSKIAWYGSDNNVYVINADGTNLINLSNVITGIPSPSICGDGSKIAFSKYDGSYYHIYIINSDGSGLQQVTNISGQDDQYPSISNDCKKIAFESSVPPSGMHIIYVVNYDGTGLLRLTNDPWEDTAPAISGDGSKIVYMGNEGKSGGYYDICIINSDGSGQQRLTNDSYDNMYPSISSDGSKIAFRRGNNDTVTINSDGTGYNPILIGSGSSPCISADATKIAFSTDMVYRINYDGTGLIPILYNTGNLPSINNNGKRIVFDKWDGAHRQIWIWDEIADPQTTSSGSNINVESAVNGMALTYPSVSSACTTIFTYNNGAGYALPTGKWAGQSNLHYFISSNCSYTTPVAVRINYNESDYFFESNLRLYRWTGSSWQDITTSLDTETNWIEGSSPSLGEFLILENSPTSVATPAGTNVEVDSGLGVKVVYDNVLSACSTSFLVQNSGGAAPASYWTGRSNKHYFILTNCSYTGQVTVKVNYSESDFVSEWLLRLGKYNPNGMDWNDITQGIDRSQNMIWGRVDTLGEFAVGEPLTSQVATPAGSNVVVDLGGVSIKYPQVLANCISYLSLGTYGYPMLPDHWPGGLLQRYFLASTCNYTGNLEVTINYDGSNYVNASSAGLFWAGAGYWQEVTSSSGTGWIKGLAPALGEFSVLERLSNPIWTPAGTDVELDLGDMKIDYPLVAAPCNTWRQDWTGGVPMGVPWLKDGTAERRYYLSSNCSVSGPIKVWINYNMLEFNKEDHLGFFYYDGFAWQETTTDFDPDNDWIAGEVNGMGLEVAVLEKLDLWDWLCLGGCGSGGGDTGSSSSSCSIFPGQDAQGFVSLLPAFLFWMGWKIKRRKG